MEMHLSLILLFLQLWANVEVSLSQNACSKPPDVPHASVSDETKKDEYAQGDVIHFTCETGYISGPTIRYVCTNNDWLAIHKGVCYLKPCVLPDDTPNGYYQIIRGEDFVFGSTIKYFCNEGYHMVSKVDTRTCLLDKWTNHVPICEPLSCEPPPADRQFTVQGLPYNEDPILPARFLTFSCDDPGKYLNGSSVLVCGPDGQWDNPFPSCEDITCEVGQMHPHLSATGLSANATVKTGQKLQFHCSDQYVLDGSEEIECLPTGKWNSRFPTCAEQCRVPALPVSVRISGPISNGQLRKGQTLRFSCRNNQDFLRGEEVVECLANGQWSDPFPTCGAPSGCRKPPPLADGDIRDTIQVSYRHNQRVEYACQNYYIMEGERYKTCHNGEWRGQMRCLKPCTVDKEAMNTHNIEFKYRGDDKLYSRHNDEIEFRCVGQRRNNGRLAMRQRCVNGVMHLPTCG